MWLTSRSPRSGRDRARRPWKNCWRSRRMLNGGSSSLGSGSEARRLAAMQTQGTAAADALRAEIEKTARHHGFGRILKLLRGGGSERSMVSRMKSPTSSADYFLGGT